MDDGWFPDEGEKVSFLKRNISMPNYDKIA